jgi:hypothetical protein
MELLLPLDDLDRDEITALKITAVNGHSVYFIGGIVAQNVAARSVARPTDSDADDARFLVRPPPLALDSDYPLAQVECQVVAAVLGDRPQNGDAPLDRLGGDDRLGDCAFVVARLYCNQDPARRG